MKIFLGTISVMTMAVVLYVDFRIIQRMTFTEPELLLLAGSGFLIVSLLTEKK